MIINGHNIPEPDNPGKWYKGWEDDYWWLYHKAANEVIDEIADPYYFYEHIKWTCFGNLTSFIRRNKSCKEAKLWVEVYEDYSINFYIQDVEREQPYLLLDVLGLQENETHSKEYRRWMDKVKDKRIRHQGQNNHIL